MSYSFRVLLFQSVLASLMNDRGSEQAPRLLAFSCSYLSILCFIECIGARMKGKEEIVWISASDLNKENKECRASLESAASFRPIKDSILAAEQLT